MVKNLDSPAKYTKRFLNTRPQAKLLGYEVSLLPIHEVLTHCPHHLLPNRFQDQYQEVDRTKCLAMIPPRWSIWASIRWSSLKRYGGHVITSLFLIIYCSVIHISSYTNIKSQDNCKSSFFPVCWRFLYVIYTNSILRLQGQARSHTTTV